MENQEPVQRQPLNHGDLKSAGPPVEEGPVTLGQWIQQNGVPLLIVLALLAFLFYKFDPGSLLNILKAFLGLSLVVFIHEMGHLLAAKWCDVHVTSFSLGFGPTIPGCSFKWGETTYKFSLIPLGGYVQMVGQIDGDEASDGSEEDPRSYKNKTVGQRMLIISAGVIMNVILAVVCFVLVFTIPGKDRTAAVISGIDTSSPSFTKGIRTGSMVTEINGREKPTFEDLMFAVRGSLEGEEIHFVFQRPEDAKALALDIEPLKKKSENPMIGLRPSQTTQLLAERYSQVIPSPVIPGSAASQATPALPFGGLIVGVRDASDPSAKWKMLRDDPRYKNQDQKPGFEQKDYFQLAAWMQDLADKKVELKLKHTDGYEETYVVPAAFGRTLGVRMGMGQITSLREGSDAAKKITPGKEGQMGDIIKEVEAIGPDGKSIKHWTQKDLDPETLPTELRKAMDTLDAKAAKKVRLHVQRHSDKVGPETKLTPVELNWDDSWRYEQYVLIYKDSPLAIPELGLAYQIKTVVTEAPEANKKDPEKLQETDWIKKVRFHYTDHKGEEKAGNWFELLEKKDDQEQALDAWAFVSAQYLNDSAPIVKMELVVDRNKEGKKEEKTIEIVPQADKRRPLTERGFRFMQDIRNEKASSIFGAVGLGMRDTHRSIMNVYLNLRGLVLGRLPVDKNLGGPARIGEMAYRIAGFDLWEFIFFLGLISINLAVVNFLPIPVLDGGHMVFLLYEKLRGKPASEGVRIGATYAGLAIILCLMGFVIFLDVTHYLR